METIVVPLPRLMVCSSSRWCRFARPIDHRCSTENFRLERVCTVFPIIFVISRIRPIGSLARHTPHGMGSQLPKRYFLVIYVMDSRLCSPGLSASFLRSVTLLPGFRRPASLKAVHAICSCTLIGLLGDQKSSLTRVHEGFGDRT